MCVLSLPSYSHIFAKNRNLLIPYQYLLVFNASVTLYKFHQNTRFGIP